MVCTLSLKNREILVFGGKQIRPNIHINDLINVYYFFLSKRDRIRSDVFNAGFENISILNIAEMIQAKTNCTIKIEKSNDPRSYRQDSSKILKTGFMSKKKVEDAIKEIIDAYNNSKLKDTAQSHTVSWMKKNNIK